MRDRDSRRAANCENSVAVQELGALEVKSVSKASSGYFSKNSGHIYLRVHRLLVSRR
jgi:hypothetical protein